MGLTGRRLVLVAAAALVAPIVVGIAVLWGETWVPVLDHAQHELRIRDVGSADTPLVGPVSTAGDDQSELNHPGPVVFDLLAVPYRLSGERSTALLIGAGLLNGACLAGLVAVAARQGGPPLALVVALGSALLVSSLGLEALFDFWNPTIAVLPFALYLLCAWAVADGSVALVPVVVALASALVQTHLSLALPVLAVAVVAAVGTAVAWRRERPAHPVRVVVGSALALVVLWAPPLVDQVAGSGNLGSIVGYAAAGGRDTIGLRAGLEVLARELALVPWAGGPESAAADPAVVAPAPVGAMAVPVALVTGAALVARRRDDVGGLWLVAVIGAAALGALGTLAAVEGEVFLHYARFLWPLGLVAAVALARTGLGSIDGEWAERWPGAVVVAGVVALSLVTVLDRPAQLWPTPPHEERIVEVVAAAVAAVDPADGPVLVSDDGTLEGRKVQTALLLQLERVGVAVAVADDEASQRIYGDHRAGREPALELVVSTDGGLSVTRRP